MTLSNLTEDLATEDTLALIAGRSNSAGDAVLVSGSKRKYRREFTDSALTEWDVVKAASQTVTTDATTGNLLVTSGTTAGATTTLTTKEGFTAPFKVAVGTRLSQKIANQQTFIEIVAENTDGSMDETVVAAWRMAGSDSTNAAIARAEVQNGETARSQSSNLTVQTYVGGDGVFEITLEADEVWFSSKPMDSAAGRLAPFVRNSVCPDPNRRYRIRLRIVNGGTAPASSTTSTFYFVSAVDYTEQQVEVTGGNGSVGLAQSVPVQVLNNLGISGGTVTPQASAGGVGTSVFKVLTAATTNAAAVKASAGRLYGYHLSNTSTGWRFVRLYNRTTAPTVGTDVPFMVIPIAPGMSAIVRDAVPVTFATGIAVAVTAASPDNDATVTAVGDVVGSLLFV